MNFAIVFIIALVVALVIGALYLMRDQPKPVAVPDSLRDALAQQGFQKLDDVAWSLKGKAKSTVFFKVPKPGSTTQELWLDRDQLPQNSLAHPGLYLRVWPKGGSEAISSRKAQFMLPEDFMPGLDVEARISLKRHGQDLDSPVEPSTLEFIKTFAQGILPNIQDLPGFEFRLGELGGSEYRLSLYWTEGNPPGSKLDKALLVLLMLEERLP